MALWFADALRRHLHWPGNLGRTLPRLLLMTFIVPSLTFFSAWWTAALVPFLLLVTLYLILFHPGRRPDRPPSHAARAILWFLGAYLLLLVVFWAPEYRYVTATGLLAGTILILGGEIGETFWWANHYTLFGREGTVEGDLLAFAAGFASLFFCLAYLWELLPVRPGMLLSLFLSLVGLLVRLVTPRDYGHFTVPVALAFSLYFLSYTGFANPLLARLLWGLVLSVAVALLGLRTRALTPDGAAAAAGVGVFILAFGGWGWAIPLVAFFVTSTALTRWKAAIKEANRTVKGKEGARDAGQVLANGLVAAVIAALTLFSSYRAGLLFLAYLGTVAEATADTWATEVGILSKKRPRLILNGVQCPPGTSGSVTPLGLWAAAAGALLISLVGAFLVWPLGPATIWLIVLPWIGGFGGALVDSLLGATLQASYYCPTCAVGAESPRHVCGTETIWRRGYPWVGNDLVNLVGTLSGALIVAGLVMLLGGG